MSVYAIMYTVCLQATLLHYLGSHGLFYITRDFNITSVQRTRPLPYHISLSYVRQ